MKKSMIIAITILLTNYGFGASAREYSFPTQMKVSIERGDEPIIKSGSNVVYPILSYFSVVMPPEPTEFNLYGIDNEPLTLTAAGDRYLIEEPISIGDEIFFAVLDGENGIKPIRTVLSGPIQIGHVHFAVGSANLSRAAKEVLRQIAVEMKFSGLFGAYLVGQTDRSGSEAANSALSQRRVAAAEKFLAAALSENQVSSPELMTEAMGEYLAGGKDGIANEFDRKVTVLLYPVG